MEEMCLSVTIVSVPAKQLICIHFLEICIYVKITAGHIWGARLGSSAASGHTRV